MRFFLPRHTYFLVLVALAATTATRAEDGLPALVVELHSGIRLRGHLAARTDEDRLWLRFGTASTTAHRSLDWKAIAAIRAGEESIGASQLIELARAARPAEPPQRSSKLVIPAADVTAGPPPVLVAPAAGSRRIASISFDAVLSNWDADVLMDGLLVEVVPLDAWGQPVAARGTVTAELFSMQRVEPDAVVHGRGRHLGLIERWTVPVTCKPELPSSFWIRLPFQSPHPELDVDWAPFGLLHLQFVIPGEGVFQHSLDGIRIRPWAPLRDWLELQTGERFFPSELN